MTIGAAECGTPTAIVIEWPPFTRIPTAWENTHVLSWSPEFDHITHVVGDCFEFEFLPRLDVEVFHQVWWDGDSPTPDTLLAYDSSWH